MLSYSHQRNFQEEPYWASNNFWPDFLKATGFDHHYFIDIFKTVVGESITRKTILKHFLGNNFLFNDFQSDDSQRGTKAKRQKKLHLLPTFIHPLWTKAMTYHHITACSFATLTPKRSNRLTLEASYTHQSQTKFGRGVSSNWNQYSASASGRTR